MTIAIGILASESDLKPDHLVLLADTKGSFGGDSSMNRLHKVFAAPDISLYTAGAGQMDRAAELFKMLHIFLTEFQGLPGYGRVFQAVHAAADCYKRVRFKYDILPKYAHIPPSLSDTFSETDLTPSLLEEWRVFDFGCQIIVGSFDIEGSALLFIIEGTGQVHNSTFPGFAAIGSGQEAALFWLSYRNHNLGFPLRRAAYQAFEAKIMAEQSPFVNDQIDLVIASKKQNFIVTRFDPKPDGVPVTVAELREMFTVYGPKETDEVK
jgi:hypothetical protein